MAGCGSMKIDRVESATEIAGPKVHFLSYDDVKSAMILL